MKVTVIGGEGFVGSAFVSHLAARPGVEVVAVTSQNYADLMGTWSDVAIEASCNSRKYFAEECPVDEFEFSVSHRLRTLHDFPADLSIHLSSVDVYSSLSSPEMTTEDAPINLSAVSNYGLHKVLAEQLVQHYARRWLIIRMAGMVGPGMRKNPIYDILHGQPLRIHPDSQYQFMATKDVARIVWKLAGLGVCGEVFNVCGAGLLSPREFATLADLPLNLDQLDPDAYPRVVHVNTRKLQQLMPIPETLPTIVQFLRELPERTPERCA